MNNYCRNCGEKLEAEVKLCPKCNTEVIENRIDIDEKQKELKAYKEKEIGLITIIILLYSFAFFSSYFSYSNGYEFILYIKPLIYLGATMTLIYARSTMHDSIKIKIIFNIFIFLTVIFFLVTLFLFMTCQEIINRC